MTQGIWFAYLLACTFVFGLAIGSFLNVCIYRIPKGEFFSDSRSACPHCGYRIRFYDNIPVLSYLILLGKCRKCKERISPRYPIVELTTGLFAMATFMHYGLTWPAIVYFLFIAALIVITFIDIDYQIIPDIITLPGIVIGIVLSFFLPDISVKSSVIGVLSGGGVLLAVAWGYEMLTGKEGMGGGDIKLLGMFGAFLGFQGVLFSLMAGAFTGSIAGVVLMLRQKKGMKLVVPFGPFLAMGALLYIFWGDFILHWYLGLFR